MGGYEKKGKREKQTDKVRKEKKKEEEEIRQTKKRQGQDFLALKRPIYTWYPMEGPRGNGTAKRLLWAY